MEARIRLTASRRSRRTVSVVLSLAALACLSAAMACTSTTEPTAVVRIVLKSTRLAIQVMPQGLLLNNSVTLTNTSAFPIVWDLCAVSLERNTNPFALPRGRLNGNRYGRPFAFSRT